METSNGLKRIVLTTLLSTALTAGLLSTPIQAATSVSTTPVGYITLKAGGTGLNLVDYSFVGISLTQAPYRFGSVSSISGTTVTDSTANWSTNPFSSAEYYLEVTSGPGAGTTNDIASAKGTSLTLDQPLATGVVAPFSYTIRKHWTVQDVFGTGSSLKLHGGDIGSADLILFFENGKFQTVYYQNGGVGGTGWRKTPDLFTDVSSLVIYPEQGFLIKTNNNTAVSIPVLGTVKIGQTSIPITPGYNLVSNVTSAPMTLKTSGLYTGLPNSGIKGGIAGDADEILIRNGKTYDRYYYQTLGVGGVGWRKAPSLFNDAGNFQIQPGQSFLVNRGTNQGVNVVIPQNPPSL